MESVLLHACCAPCSVFCVESLRAEGIEPMALWYNPNIHPYQEYKARRDTLCDYAARIGMALRVWDDYGLRDFTRAVCGAVDQRCGHCYRLRLFGAARYAAEQGFAAFTTSLLISPYQNHDLLRQTGEAAAREYGVRFLYRDFRPGFRAGQTKAREEGLYLQKYCGCIYSEEERYQKQIQRDHARFADTAQDG